MNVGEIMTTGVKTVEPNEPVALVARIMALKRISGVPVTDGGRLVGVLSEKDILRAMYPSYKEFTDSPLKHMDFKEMERRYSELEGMRAENLMTRNVASVIPETPILKAASMMILRKVRRLPVVDDEGKVVGIVSQGDVHRAVFERQFGQ
jgi:CBS-domain-containing membrane protein